MLAEDYVELISDVKDKRLTELAKIKQQDPTPELLSKYHSAPSSEPVKYTKKTFIGTKRTVEVKTTSDVREYLKSFDNTLRNTEIEQMVKLFETNPSRFNRIANSGLFDLVDKGYIDLKTYKCLFDGIKINENIFFSNRILNECKLAKSQLEKGITPTLVKTIPDNAANDYILKNINVGDVFEQNGKLYVKSDKFGNATQINMSKKTFDELFPPVKSSAFKQGGIGDCWLVSVIDNALDYPEGRAKIFSMFEQIDNDIYVKLPGSDLNVKYINGDIVDANGIQMVEQACMCHALSTNRKNFTAQEISALTNVEEQMVMLDNGTASEAWEMLFERGATHRIYDINKIKDTIKHFSNSTDHMLYISFKEGKPIPGKREGLIDEARELWSGHAYALKSYDPKTNMCYITNPWNASKLIEVPMDEILTHIYHISDFQFT